MCTNKPNPASADGVPQRDPLRLGTHARPPGPLCETKPIGAKRSRGRATGLSPFFGFFRFPASAGMTLAIPSSVAAGLWPVESLGVERRVSAARIRAKQSQLRAWPGRAKQSPWASGDARPTGASRQTRRARQKSGSAKPIFDIGPETRVGLQVFDFCRRRQTKPILGGRKQAVHRYKRSQLAAQATKSRLQGGTPNAAEGKGATVRNEANFGRPPAVAQPRRRHLSLRTSRFAKKRLAASLRTRLCRAKRSQLASADARPTGAFVRNEANWGRHDP